MNLTILITKIETTNIVVTKGTYKYIKISADGLRLLLINHNTGIAGNIPILLIRLIVPFSTLFFKIFVMIPVEIITYNNIETGDIKILIIITPFDIYSIYISRVDGALRLQSLSEPCFRYLRTRLFTSPFTVNSYFLHLIH